MLRGYSWHLAFGYHLSIRNSFIPLPELKSTASRRLQDQGQDWLQCTSLWRMAQECHQHWHGLPCNLSFRLGACRLGSMCVCVEHFKKDLDLWSISSGLACKGISWATYPEKRGQVTSQRVKLPLWPRVFPSLWGALRLWASSPKLLMLPSWPAKLLVLLSEVFPPGKSTLKRLRKRVRAKHVLGGMNIDHFGPSISFPIFFFPPVTTWWFRSSLALLFRSSAVFVLSLSLLFSVPFFSTFFGF